MTFKEIIKSIEKKEWQFVILLIVLVVILASLPYVVGYLNTPDGYYFKGVHALTPGDIFVYFSYINQVKAGHFLLQDFFTSEAQSGGLLNLLWLPIGLMAKLFKLSPLVSFHLARIILIPLLLVCAYVFLSYFFSDKKQRQLAMILLAFGSGWGAYLAPYFDHLYPQRISGLIYKWPIDLWVSEANIFLSATQTPHFIISWILLLVCFLSLLLAWENNKYGWSILAGLSALYWFNFHPYYFPYAVLILFVYCAYLFFKYKKINYWLHFFVFLALSLPSIIYHYYEIKTNLWVGMRASQNITLTPPFVFVAVGFGALFLGAIAGLVYLLKKKKFFANDKYLFLLFWLIIGFVMLYLPVAFQRRFLLGLQIPLSIFTVVFLFGLVDFIKNKLKNRLQFFAYFHLSLAFIVFMLFGFSTLFNLSRDLYYNIKQNPALYLSLDYKNVAQWLAENNQAKKIILSNESIGYVLPSLINQQVYLGHGHETLFFEAKETQVKAFFSNQLSLEETARFLSANNVGYIVVASKDAAPNNVFLNNQDFLSTVYNGFFLTIYAFNQ